MSPLTYLFFLLGLAFVMGFGMTFSDIKFELRRIADALEARNARDGIKAKQ